MRRSSIVLAALVLYRCYPDIDGLREGAPGKCAAEAGCGGTSDGGAGAGGDSSGSAGMGVPGSSGDSGVGADAGAGVGAGGEPGGESGAAGVAGETSAGSGGADGSCIDPVKGQVLFEFNDATLSGQALLGNVWSTLVEDAPPGSPSGDLIGTMLGWSADEGRSCPGALSLSVPFATYGEPKRAMALVNFNASWIGKTALHAWVKLSSESGSFNYLQGVQLSVSSGAYTAFRGQFVNIGLFADGGWHELIVPLHPLDPPQVGAFVPAMVRQIGVQVVALPSAPAAGPTAPVPTVMYVDDVWLQ